MQCGKDAIQAGRIFQVGGALPTIDHLEWWIVPAMRFGIEDSHGITRDGFGLSASYAGRPVVCSARQTANGREVMWVARATWHTIGGNAEGIWMLWKRSGAGHR